MLKWLQGMNSGVENKKVGVWLARAANCSVNDKGARGDQCSFCTDSSSALSVPSYDTCYLTRSWQCTLPWLPSHSKHAETCCAWRINFEICAKEVWDTNHHANHMMSNFPKQSQFIYTEQNLQTKFYPKKNTWIATICCTFSNQN